MFSFWEKDVFLKKYDVVIIGAGFSGLWLAYFLKKYRPKIEIAILEAGTLPTGASTKNAGFSCFGSPTELLENITVMGLDQAMFWAEQRHRGISMIAQYFGSEIEFDDCGGTELFNDKTTFEETKEQLNDLNQSIKSITGSDNHFFIDESVINQAGFSGFQYAIKNDVEGSIHSGKLINSMIEVLQAQKVKIFFGVEVENFEENQEETTIIAKNGMVFRANHLSITTNAFTKRLLPEVDLYPGRGQVLITEPIEGLNWRGTFHFDKGYYYFRNYRNRVLFGGGRNLDFQAENTDEFALTELVQNRLEQLLYENIIPKHKNVKIDQRWSGIMAFDDTKTPVSKCLSQRVSLSVRMNGMGVALAPTLSESLAKEILTIF
ncbi:FAD-dependent oxidoreductase [Emticicia aquatilis]|uniref:FAD-dependent oxidoreductase n=2 Tax=Emticicia aquatilis TaxID=1537369 RepID=A0A916YSD2_9BACT|nr:FAD-dependent oxidoreductase [Emticicia aquatilis]